MDGHIFLRPEGGGILNATPYVYWNQKSKEAVLDGIFTVDMLRELADYMDRHRTKDAS